MRKLAPAQVSSQDDLFILYHIFMRMGHFKSRLFERTLHIDKIPLQFKDANMMRVLPVSVHLQTDFTLKGVVVLR